MGSGSACTERTGTSRSCRRSRPQGAHVDGHALCLFRRPPVPRRLSQVLEVCWQALSGSSKPRTGAGDGTRTRDIRLGRHVHEFEYGLLENPPSERVTSTSLRRVLNGLTSSPFGSGAPGWPGLLLAAVALDPSCRRPGTLDIYRVVI